jgi:hypothetical protein
VSRTYRKHMPIERRRKWGRAGTLKSNKQRRPNERRAIRKEYT